MTSAIVSAVAGQSRRRASKRVARRTRPRRSRLSPTRSLKMDRRRRSSQRPRPRWAASFGACGHLLGDGGTPSRASHRGGAAVSEAEIKAAENALEAQAHFRGETYPKDDSKFDLWPVATPAARRYVMGVDFHSSVFERPPDPERFIEIVGRLPGVLAGGLRRSFRAGHRSCPRSRLRNRLTRWARASGCGGLDASPRGRHRSMNSAAMVARDQQDQQDQ